MGVSLEKIQQEAPHLVETVNMVKKISADNGLNSDENAATVVATFDLSGSNSENYHNGTMQRVGHYALAAAFSFDDDGLVPFSYFHDRVVDLGNIDLPSSKGFVQETWNEHPMGGTSYLAALDWIIKSVGLADVDLGKKGDPLEVKFNASNPVFAIFATDGEPASDRKEDIDEKIRRMSQLPIFVQFIGVGNHNFDYLKKLDKLDGRLIDNAGFFDSKDVLSGKAPVKKRFGFKREAQPGTTDEKELMLHAMLSEFPSYYKNARKQGLVTR